MKRRILNAAVAVVSVAYPLLALALVRHIGARGIVVMVAGLILLRLLAGDKGGVPAVLTYGVAGAGIALAATSAVDADLAMRLYPVFMNAAMLMVFSVSLIHPPSVIERFARLQEPDLPPSGVAYTRRVTMAWCAFLAANGCIALWTALFQPLKIWAIYNGVVAYVLMGVMLGGEWVLRGYVRKRDRQEGSGI